MVSFTSPLSTHMQHDTGLARVCHMATSTVRHLAQYTNSQLPYKNGSATMPTVALLLLLLFLLLLLLLPAHLTALTWRS